MIKTVNIYSKTVIGTVTPPIFGNVLNKKMSTGDILRCLCMRATVDEIMPDGSTVRLNTNNYYVDFVQQWNDKHLNKHINTTPTVNTPEIDSPKTEGEWTKVITVNDRIQMNDFVDIKVPETPVDKESTEDPVVETASNTLKRSKDFKSNDSKNADHKSNNNKK